MSRIFTSVSQLVGGTPLLELCRTEREAEGQGSGQAGVSESRRQR